MGKTIDRTQLYHLFEEMPQSTFEPVKPDPDADKYMRVLPPQPIPPRGVGLDEYGRRYYPLIEEPPEPPEPASPD